MSDRTQRRKEKLKSPKSRHRPQFQEDCMPITVEQFQLANKVAHAAGTGRMPRQSFASTYEEAVERGEVSGPCWVLKDLPINHAAFAIMDLVPEKTEEGDKLRRALLWRALLMPEEVFDDPRATAYRQRKDGQDYVGVPLIEAMATVPMKMDMKAPLDAIFAKAAELAREWQRDADLAARA